MRGTVLIENTAPEGSGLAFEPGLSVYIEYNGKKILLDGGISGRFAENAEALGVDLGAVELGVLSHGHFDHADGLGEFFKRNEGVKILHRPGAQSAYWSTAKKPPYFIGIDRGVWENWRERFEEIDGIYPLCEGAWLLPDGEVDPAFTGRATDLCYERGEGDYIPDDFRHEQSLVFETQRGLAVFNSCSHSGIVNIVRGVQKMMPGKPVYAVVGGFHMFGKGTPNGMNCSEEYVYKVADELRRLGVEEVYTGHCTGLPALKLLKERFGEGCHGLTTGMTFEL
jgi:7,8-dihydropterin-6-yl-methyl-4-(beta-D-ribofuranosyl)aminobenzene 5'-phosphate synthase